MVWKWRIGDIKFFEWYIDVVFLEKFCYGDSNWCLYEIFCGNNSGFCLVVDFYGL